MSIKSFTKSLLVLVTMFSVQSLFAQNVTLHTITTAVPFLRINPDARAAGMGTAGVAASADANAVYINPARLAFIETDGGFSPGLVLWRLFGNNMYLPSLTGYYKIKHKQVVAISARYFDMGKVMLTDANGTNIGLFTPHEFAIDAHYARQLSQYVSLSVSARFIYSQLLPPQMGPSGYQAGLAGAGDLGLYYHRTYHQNDDMRMQHTFSFGAAITNLGNKIKYTQQGTGDYLPANLAVGFGYKLDINKHNSLAVHLDLNKLLVPSPNNKYDSVNQTYYFREQNPVKAMFTSFGDAPALQELRYITTGIGIEYYLYNILGVRTGYFYEHPSAGGRQFITLGISGKYSIASIAVSTFISTNPQSPLYNFITLPGVYNAVTKASFFITLSFDFMKGGSSKKSAAKKADTKAA
jgi:hypothetical protein